MINKRLELVGQKFGRLRVLKFSYVNKGRQSCWLCKCDCGNEKVIIGSRLKGRRVISCGCYMRETTGRLNYKHGDSSTRLYNIWRGMRNRCNNEGYKNYGGRGIKVCEEWKEYILFRDWALENGYQDRLSIDRLDNDGNYEPGNCRWADRKTQNGNQRVYCALVDYSTEELIQELKRRNLGKIFSAPNNNI